MLKAWTLSNSSGEKMIKHKITPEQKQAVADLLGITIDKIPEEVDWDENEVEDDEEEEEDEEDEEDDEESDEDEDDSDEDEDSESEEARVAQAIEDYNRSPKTIPFSDFLKNRGM